MLGLTGMTAVQKEVVYEGVVVYSIDTYKPGPTVVLTANIHGYECTGFATALHFIEQLPSSLCKGKVVIYPSLNPQGLAQHRRVHPRDGKDMNRLFPGKRMGGIAERHVSHIWTSIARHTPDVILDLHTDSGDAIPYVLIDRVLKGKKNKP